MWILPVVALLFLGGLAYNLVTGESTTGDATIQVSIAAIAGAYWGFFRHEQRMDERFLAWLATEAARLKLGEATYSGGVVSQDTELRQFQSTVSFFLVSLKLQSRMVLPNDKHGIGLGIGCTVASLIFGWWAIPLGPIWTLQSVLVNVRGGRRFTVAELLAGTEENAK